MREDEKCIFFNEEINECNALAIVKAFDRTDTPVNEITEEFKRVICRARPYACMRRIYLAQIIETGSWGQ